MSSFAYCTVEMIFGTYGIFVLISVTNMPYG